MQTTPPGRTHRRESSSVVAPMSSSSRSTPPGHSAWKLVDAAGCRGLRVGGAQVSEMHCNFLINTGAATASDLEALGEEVRSRVARACGVELEWEIRRVGVSLDL